MEKKKIFIVEDKPAQKLALANALTMRGFHVESASNVTEARDWAKKLSGKIDVCVLDMRLEDKREPNLTGANIGLEIRMATPRFPPEFIIHSAYSEVDYYKSALKLHVAAYLHKEDYKNDQDQLIRHIRALALRRSLSVENPDAAKQIQRISASSRNRSEAIVKFCKEVLANSLKSSLGAPFIILFTENERTQCCASDAGLPTGFHPDYYTLQALTLANTKVEIPFVFSLSAMKSIPDIKDSAIFKKLDGAAFLSLATTKDFSLSLGIIQGAPREEHLEENAEELAKVLAQYFKQVVIEYLLSILFDWAEQEGRRRAILKEMAQVCLYVGQEQLAAQDNNDQEKIKLLAEDLRETGRVLMSIIEEDEDSNSDSERQKPWSEALSMSEFIEGSWEDLVSFEKRIPIKALKLSGNCMVRATKSDLFIVILGFLEWFTQRFADMPKELQEIRVNCSAKNEGSEIVFEDNGIRWDEPLRQRLFEPFSQAVYVPGVLMDAQTDKKRAGRYLPLYLAKMLVEVRYQGRIEDLSDEIEGERGHRFSIWFPNPDAAESNPNSSATDA